jgi:acyl-CoA hydrolase
MTKSAKPPAESLVEMTEMVMPSDANVLGTAFGGKVMQWIDLAAALSAQRHSRTAAVVTASIDELAFLAPVRIGHVAILRAQVNAVFSTSMEVGVTVDTEDPRTGDRRKCCSALVTFVALDASGKPTRVPALAAGSAEEKRREEEARARREQRLASRASRQ